MKRLCCFCLVTVMVLSLFVVDTVATEENIVINEVMASNKNTIKDTKGSASDWIELYNRGSAPVKLGGKYLSDSKKNLTQFKFPDDAVLEGGKYLIIWCDGTEGVSDGCYYAPFKISEGETVYLTCEDGITIIDSLKANDMLTDESIGKIDNTTNEVAIFTNPTPFRENDISSKKLVKPSFSKKAGFYTEGFDLEITSGYNNAEIYYTLDGSEPAKNSLKYNGPVHIDSRKGEKNTISEIPTNTLNTNRAWQKPGGEVFKANVVKACVFLGDDKSVTACATYFVDKDIFSRYGVNVVSLTTDNENLFDNEKGIYVAGNHTNYANKGSQWERSAFFEYFDKNGKREVSQNVGIRIHGAFSRSFPQKSIRVYARSEYGKGSIEYPFFEDNNAEKFKSIILRNSGNDFGNTMFLDALYQHFWKENKNAVIQDFCPAVLFINGEYWGISNIREHYSEEYFATHFGGESKNYVIAENGGVAIDGENKNDNKSFIDIANFASKNDMNNDANYKRVEEVVDLDNMAVYFAAEIFAGNNDWPGNNLGLFKYKAENGENTDGFKDGKWRFFIKDVDQAYAFRQINYKIFDKIKEAYETGKKNYPVMLFVSMLKSEKFRNKFYDVLCDAANANLSRENVCSVTEKYKEIYRELIDEHILRWGSPQNFDVWEQMVDRYKAFGNRRMANIEFQLKTFMPDVCKTEFNGFNAGLTVINENDEYGKIKINGLYLPNSNTVRCTYRENAKVTLTAVANEGYRFAGWSGAVTSKDEAVTLNLNGTSNQISAVFEEITQ